MKLQIRHHITDFKYPAYIYHKDNNGNLYTIGEVYNWDDIEHCIIQVLYTNDNSYFLKIKDQEINLLDEDIFDKVYKIYPNQLGYACMTYNIINNLHNGIKDATELQNYNQTFGTRFKTK